MEHAFNGKWLRRAWLDNVTGWVGDLPSPTRGIPILGYEGVFSAQHGWAFAGGSFDGDGGGALNTTLASLHECYIERCVWTKSFISRGHVGESSTVDRDQKIIDLHIITACY